jgi:hypothetical protein
MSGYDQERDAFFKDKVETFFKDKVASLEQKRAIQRLSKEYAKISAPTLSEYEIEIVDPLHWIIQHTVHGEPVTLDVEFPEKYPFSAPEVKIVEPYLFKFVTTHFGPTKMFADFLKNIDTYIDEIKKKLDTNTLNSIESAKHAEEPLYLIMGANPKEKRKGRTFYDDPHYYMLDYADIEGESTRYFHINMVDVDALAYIAIELPNRFQTICFDWSTFKFFTELDLNVLLRKIACLKRLLKDDGRIYFESPGTSPGGVFQKRNIRPDYLENLKQTCSLLELFTREADLSELSNDPVLHEVYRKRNDSVLNPERTDFLIASKQQLSGGTRKYHKSRKTRKVRKNRRRSASRKRV